MGRKKKARTRGQIRTRGLDKWLVRVYLGTDAQGKKKYSSKMVNGPRRDAERKLTEMLREVDTQTFVEPSRTSLSDFLDRYLDQRTDLSPKTLYDYRSMARNNINPYLGGQKLEDLTPMMVSQLYNVTLLQTRGLSGRTIQAAHQILSQALSKAVQWGHLAKNPCEHVTLPRVSTKEVATLTSEQVQALLGRTSGTEMGTLWTLLLTTGLRPQEALALKWSDLDGSHLTVQRALKRTGSGSYEARETKTRGSRRRVLLPQTTVEALKAHRIRQAEEILQLGTAFDRSGNWIFCTSKGTLYYVSHIYRAWKRDLESAGLPTNFRLYDTRHTHATLLLLNGVNPKVASERLGHSGVRITLDTYSHVLPEMQEDAVAAMESTLFGRKEAAAV